MKKSSELNIEERLCEYLKMNYRGSGNQLSSKIRHRLFHHLLCWQSVLSPASKYLFPNGYMQTDCSAYFS